MNRTITRRGLLEELRVMRDEIRVRIHLANMEVKDEWNRLEPHLLDLEQHIEGRMKMSSRAAAKLAREVRAGMRELRGMLYERAGTMLVADVMTAVVKSCRLGDPLVRALEIMSEEHCGAVPVENGQGLPIAMITDRDIAMAFYTHRGLTLGSTISAAMSQTIYTCRSEQTIAEAMRIMREQQVRRLAVVSDAGLLVGLLSLSDILQRVHEHGPGVALAQVVDTYAALTTLESTAHA